MPTDINKEKDDLFKDTSVSENIVITKNGARVNLSIEELLKKEREKGDIDEILENVKDENDFVDTEYGECNIKKALDDRDKAMKEEEYEI